MTATSAIPIRVLVSLHKGYGLGDAVQMSSVLRHVAKARPHWIIDYQAEDGKYQAGRGTVANTFAYGQPYPSSHYDAEVQMILFDTWYGWHDRPNTRVSSCLHERFHLPWCEEYGQYKIEVGEEASRLVELLLKHDRFVAVHYEGDSSSKRKDLSHNQADEICRYIGHIGYLPLVLDWRYKSKLVDHCRLRSPAAWGSNAEMVCAVIRRCRAFVGIDSGPAKCASATSVPALVVWTGHHPAPFHDPAPNTVHLVPSHYHSLEPVHNDAKVIEWFEANYRTRNYKNDPVEEIKSWLSETLR